MAGFPGILMSEQERLEARRQLEIDVQNYIGPIRNIEKLSDSLLYGIRDSFAKAIKDNTEKMRETMQLDAMYEDSDRK